MLSLAHALGDAGDNTVLLYNDAKATGRTFPFHLTEAVVVDGEINRFTARESLRFHGRGTESRATRTLYSSTACPVGALDVQGYPLQ